MKKTILITAILSITILAGCYNAIVNKPSGENSPVIPGSDMYVALSTEEANIKGINPFTFKEDNYQEQNIYEAGGGKILVKSDKLYLFDVQGQKVAAEAPLKSFDIPEEYYVTEEGYCVVGAEPTESQRITKVWFYNKNLDIVQEFNLNEVLGEPNIHVQHIAVAKTGKKIAYATSKGLFLYDLDKKAKQTLLNLGSESTEANKGLAILSDIAFFDKDTKLAFIGFNYEEKGKEKQTIVGTISADGFVIVNEKAELPRLRHMEVTDDYIAFSENTYPINTGEPAGKVIIIDNAAGQILRHTLQDKNEGSNVFLSEKGKNFMTYVQNGDKEVIYRIYDTKTGKLVRETKQEFDGKTDEKYMKTYIEIFDDTNTFIAVSTFYNSEPVVTISEWIV